MSLRYLSTCYILVALVPAALPAQDRAAAHALSSWIALDASPADEHRAAAAIMRAAPGWTLDAQGNLVRRLGRGTPRRVIACGIDHFGYVVSAITDAGYLRLHRSGNAPVHPLWDQAHEGQQIAIRTATGTVPGVVAIANGHFARQHRADTTVTGVDQLWVDVGATSRADVSAMGVALMDPVRRDVPAWEYANEIAGADASGRTGCAAVAAVGTAASAPAAGELVFIISTMRSFGWSGLGGALARVGPVSQLTLVMPAALARGGARAEAAVTTRRMAPPAAPATVRADSLDAMSVRAAFAGTLVESVNTADAKALRDAVAVLASVDASRAPWITLGADAPAPVRRDQFSDLAETLRRLSDLPGVPGHEFRVRDAVRSLLPAWARARSAVDSAGNLWFAVGPARDTTVVMAHLDEVSWVVSSIRADGRVALDARGGPVPSAWEGQPALLHFDPAADESVSASLPGVFVPRDTATLRAPRGMTAWFGMDSASLVARGVRVGQGVTAYKRAERIGAARFTGRALDDRVGTTALVMALAGLDTTTLDHTVIFAWSTAEESGLVGARAMAQRLGSSVKRVYAVDTFVSSDTPLEQPTFALVPLGGGPVLRALDDGIAVSRAERERVLAAGRRAGVTVQVGTTHGSTDGTAFVQWGAVGVGISWPGRYSHTPGEVLDLRDVTGLVKLIRAVVTAPAR